MTELTVIDPGRATGFLQGYYDRTTPFEITKFEVWSFDQLSNYVWTHHSGQFWTDVLVVERFRLLQGNEFAANLDGVRVEGVIDHCFSSRVETVAQWRTDKSLVSDRILKEHGLWRDGYDVGWEDGRDVNDCTIHALVYLRRKRHMPTLRKYFKED